MQCTECAGRSCGPKGIAACSARPDTYDYYQNIVDNRRDAGDEEDPETEREMFDWATGGVR